MIVTEMLMLPPYCGWSPGGGVGVSCMEGVGVAVTSGGGGWTVGVGGTGVGVSSSEGPQARTNSKAMARPTPRKYLSLRSNLCFINVHPSTGNCIPSFLGNLITLFRFVNIKLLAIWESADVLQ